MPLDTYFPTIDDRRFDDIMTEVRTRIARYTPEWTPVWSDVNDSDPGITMVQVFAWLSEMMLYRMGQVPKLNYLKFLQLLGIELAPAEPAAAEISFPVREDTPAPVVVVPLRTQVSAASPDGAPLIFETERALNALAARLASVQVADAGSFSLVTAENTAAQGFQPFGPYPQPDNALYLGLSYGAKSKLVDLPQAELNLAVWAKESTGGTGAINCGLPASAAFAPARINWEYWNGTDWASLSLLKDETLALTRTGHVSLKLPKQGTLPKLVLGADSEARFWIRARLLASQYERAPELMAVRTNTVAAQQAETIADEALGGSSGSRDQVFTLANTPVLNGSLRVQVDEGEGFQSWTQVDDFFGSGPGDRVYVLNRTTGEVRFGDGINGAIPVSFIDNPDANIVAREYRIGGGQRGNVPAGAIKTLASPVSGVDDNGVANLFEAAGGRDEETLDEAKKRAPLAIKSRCRAVTAEDFEFLARQAANIKRAKALALWHPSFPGVKVPGVMTVVVVPDGSGPNPIPSQGTLRTVCAYLDQRRLLTTELYVIGPSYQQVTVTAAVIVQDAVDLAEAKEAIEASLLTYFHPLHGGEDGLGWPFGGTIFYSRVYHRVFGVDGVQTIETLTINLDGEDAADCKDVPINDGGLLYSTEHIINVRYGFEQ